MKIPGWIALVHEHVSFFLFQILHLAFKPFIKKVENNSWRVEEHQEE